MKTQPVIPQIDWSQEENALMAANSAKLMRQLSPDAIEEVAKTYEAFLNRTHPEHVWRVSRSYNGRLSVSASSPTSH